MDFKLNVFQCSMNELNDQLIPEHTPHKKLNFQIVLLFHPKMKRDFYCIKQHENADVQLSMKINDQQWQLANENATQLIYLTIPQTQPHRNVPSCQKCDEWK